MVEAKVWVRLGMLIVAALVITGFAMFGFGCDVPSLPGVVCSECPAYDCSQCEVTLGDCLDAGFDLLTDGDE